MIHPLRTEDLLSDTALGHHKKLSLYTTEGCLNAALASYFPGLHSCIMMTKDILYQSTMWPALK